MSTPGRRLSLSEWVRDSLRQLDETSGGPPWNDADDNDERTAGS